ncbi:MAG: formimidoylglutamase [Myxococcota bacterium]
MKAYLRAPPRPRGRIDAEDGPAAQRVFQRVGAAGPTAVLGFACDVGVTRNRGRAGAASGPEAIRNALFSLAAPEGLMPLTDLGDVVVPGDDLEAGQSRLAAEIARGLAVHERLLVLGGGHETAYGSYCGLRTRYPDAAIGILNLDAHLDLRNVGEAGPSSGTPFNQIRSMAPERFDYACIGVARESNTQALIDRAAAWSVELVYDVALRRDADAASEVIQRAVERADVVYLTIDIDVLPQFEAPGVSAPATRGVPLVTVERIVDQVMSACRRTRTELPLVDVVEVAPPYDRDHVTAKAAAYLALKYLCDAPPPSFGGRSTVTPSREM